jgi:hypothetical protein
VAADERRSARLLFAPELARGEISEEELDRAEVHEAVTSRLVPSRPSRELQRLAVRNGKLDYERDCVEPFQAARRAVLGDRAAGAPRLLIRVDEFPYYGGFVEPHEQWTNMHDVFHHAMAGTPYLLSLLPAVALEPLRPEVRRERELTDDDVALIQRMRSEGVAFALHGHNHRTRSRKPHQHSELAGLGRGDLEELLDRAFERLAERAGVRPRVFVPPYNRFSHRQYATLASRFDVIGGGPESVRNIGWHRTPLWRGDAVWMPVYHPLYGRASEVLPVVDRLVESGAALWVPIVLHVSWEGHTEWADLDRFVRSVGRHAAPWEDFLEAVDASR